MGVLPPGVEGHLFIPQNMTSLSPILMFSYFHYISFLDIMKINIIWPSFVSIYQPIPIFTLSLPNQESMVYRIFHSLANFFTLFSSYTFVWPIQQIVVLIQPSRFSATSWPDVYGAYQTIDAPTSLSSSTSTVPSILPEPPSSPTFFSQQSNKRFSSLLRPLFTAYSLTCCRLSWPFYTEVPFLTISHVFVPLLISFSLISKSEIDVSTWVLSQGEREAS